MGFILYQSQGQVHQEYSNSPIIVIEVKRLSTPNLVKLFYSTWSQVSRELDELLGDPRGSGRFELDLGSGIPAGWTSDVNCGTGKLGPPGLNPGVDLPGETSRAPKLLGDLLGDGGALPAGLAPPPIYFAPAAKTPGPYEFQRSCATLPAPSAALPAFAPPWGFLGVGSFCDATDPKMRPYTFWIWA